MVVMAAWSKPKDEKSHTSNSAVLAAVPVI